ncbi:uncharacterized protein PWA37_001543 [Arxiozyma heterogenica]|uniref:Uncharacterized protein n=1 Tax=Arxiozyma heterogenica TaxID=278026 RepID=A0AAN7WMX7_9SACH|nr:hypothetical protein RI543_002620 [Kazachstania heterogenica]
MSSYNDIFERAVQDPCSDACDCEDSIAPTDATVTTTISSTTIPIPIAADNILYKNIPNRRLPQKIIFNDVFDDDADTEEDNADEEENEKKHTHKYTRRHNSDDAKLDMTKHALRKVNTSPLHNIVSVPQRPQLHNRANSCALIHQLSRSNSNAAANPLPYPKREDAFLTRTSSANYFSNSRSNNITRNNSYISDFHCNSLRRQSSSLAIPTHIYGLEKYVSSELDELSSSCVGPNTQSITTSPSSSSPSPSPPPFNSTGTNSRHNNNSKNHYSNSSGYSHTIKEAKSISSNTTSTRGKTSASIPQKIENSSDNLSSSILSPTSVLSSASSTTSTDVINTNKKKSTPTSHLIKWKNAALKKTHGLKPTRKSFIKVSLANSFA